MSSVSETAALSSRFGISGQRDIELVGKGMVGMCCFSVKQRSLYDRREDSVLAGGPSNRSRNRTPGHSSLESSEIPPVLLQLACRDRHRLRSASLARNPGIEPPADSRSTHHHPQTQSSSHLLGGHRGGQSWYGWSVPAWAPDESYTVTATALDKAGNKAAAVGACTVPHDSGK
jgi:hypothetical protein